MVLDKLYFPFLIWINHPGVKYFVNPEQFIMRKLKKTVLNTIAFYLEVDKYEEVDCVAETLTYILQMI